MKFSWIRKWHSNYRDCLCVASCGDQSLHHTNGQHLCIVFVCAGRLTMRACYASSSIVADRAVGTAYAFARTIPREAWVRCSLTTAALTLRVTHTTIQPTLEI
jgi:hypothetical protein